MLDRLPFDAAFEPLRGAAGDDDSDGLRSRDEADPFGADDAMNESASGSLSADFSDDESSDPDEEPPRAPAMVYEQQLVAVPAPAPTRRDDASNVVALRPDMGPLAATPAPVGDFFEDNDALMRDHAEHERRAAERDGADLMHEYVAPLAPGDDAAAPSDLPTAAPAAEPMAEPMAEPTAEPTSAYGPPVGDEPLLRPQNVPGPEGRDTCCLTTLGVRAAENASRATSGTDGDHGEEFKTDDRNGMLYLLELATGCGLDGHLYGYFKKNEPVATRLVHKLAANAAALLPWTGQRRALLPVPHGGLVSGKGNRVHGLATKIAERAPGARVVDTVLKLNRPLGPKVFNDLAKRRRRHDGHWNAKVDELDKLRGDVDTLVVVDDGSWTRSTLDAIVQDLRSKIDVWRLPFRVETLVFARLVSYTHPVSTFKSLKPSIATEVATVAKAEMALHGDKSTSDGAHGGFYYRICVPWIPNKFYVGSHIVDKKLWRRHGKAFLKAVRDGVVPEICRLSKIMLAKRAYTHQSFALDGTHNRLFTDWFKRCKAFARDHLQGKLKKFHVKDYIEMQAFVPSVSGETRQGFLRRFVRGLEQGGLDDVFARFPGYILNVERLANGSGSGGAVFYVLDPRQNNRPVPAGWTIDSQEQRARTQAARGLPVPRVRTEAEREAGPRRPEREAGPRERGPSAAARARRPEREARRPERERELGLSGKDSFPAKLHDMVMQHSDVIRWDAATKTLRIQRNRIEAVLRSYFRAHKYMQFQKQLSYHGFSTNFHLSIYRLPMRRGLVVAAYGHFDPAVTDIAHLRNLRRIARPRPTRPTAPAPAPAPTPAPTHRYRTRRREALAPAAAPTPAAPPASPTPAAPTPDDVLSPVDDLQQRLVRLLISDQDLVRLLIRDQDAFHAMCANARGELEAWVAFLEPFDDV